MTSILIPPGGTQGPVGPAGPTGPQGPGGASGTFYEYNYNATTTAPPGNGNFRFNNSNQTLATLLWVNDLDANNVDMSIVWKLAQIEDIVYLQDKNDATKYQKYRVSGTVNDLSGYIEIPITWLSGGSVLLPGPSQPCVAFIARKGPATRTLDTSWGVQKWVNVYTSQAGPIVGTEVDITGATVTWTSVTNRMYKTTLRCAPLSTVATDIVMVRITDEANALKLHTRIVIPSNNMTMPVTVILLEVGTGSSMTRKGRIYRENGTGNVSITANAASPIQIFVEDVGQVPT